MIVILIQIFDVYETSEMWFKMRRYYKIHGAEKEILFWPHTFDGAKALRDGFDTSVVNVQFKTKIEEQ